MNGGYACALNYKPLLPPLLWYLISRPHPPLPSFRREEAPKLMSHIGPVPPAALLRLSLKFLTFFVTSAPNFRASVLRPAGGSGHTYKSVQALFMMFAHLEMIHPSLLSISRQYTQYPASLASLSALILSTALLVPLACPVPGADPSPGAEANPFALPTPGAAPVPGALPNPGADPTPGLFFLSSCHLPMAFRVGSRSSRLVCPPPKFRELELEGCCLPDAVGPGPETGSSV